MYSLQWPWKDPPVKVVTKQLPPGSPIRKPAPVQQEVKYVQRPTNQPPQRPGLCPVFIPKDFHSLPNEGLVKAEILPYSSVPLDFRPISGDTSTQQSWQNAPITRPVEALQTFQPGVNMQMFDAGLQQGDRLISQSYMTGPLAAQPVQLGGPGLNQMLQPQFPGGDGFALPMQLAPAASLPPGLPPVAQNTMGNRTPTKDPNQALYSGGKDYWA